MHLCKNTKEISKDNVSETAACETFLSIKA